MRFSTRSENPAIKQNTVRFGLILLCDSRCEFAHSKSIAMRYAGRKKNEHINVLYLTKVCSSAKVLQIQWSKVISLTSGQLLCRSIKTGIYLTVLSSEYI